MVTRQLAEFVCLTRYEDIPQEVVEQSKLVFLDWLGVTLCGANEPLAGILLELLGELDGPLGPSQATVIGKGLKTDVLKAALANGCLSHALDLDDYHGAILAHPTVTLLPGILAVAEWKRMSGKDVITALVVGFEVLATIGRAAGRIHYDRGWHATSTLGRFGAAAAVAKLLGLEEERVINALGIAGTQAGGVRQVFGTMCKPFHAGKASMDGVLSALLAAKGFTSSKQIIEGKHGFLDVFSSGSGFEAAIGDLGKIYHILGVSFKPYASCAFTHSTIDLMRRVRNKIRGDFSGVEEVRVEVNRGALDAAGNPAPRTGLEAKFSLWYCAAVALKDGEVGIDKFSEEKVADPQVLELMRKIRVVPVSDQELHLGARVAVRMRDGSVHEESTPSPRGAPQNPLSYDELVEKFTSLASQVLTNARARELAETIRSLERVKDVSSLVSMTCP